MTWQRALQSRGGGEDFFHHPREPRRIWIWIWILHDESTNANAPPATLRCCCQAQGPRQRSAAQGKASLARQAGGQYTNALGVLHMIQGLASAPFYSRNLTNQSTVRAPPRAACSATRRCAAVASAATSTAMVRAMKQTQIWAPLLATQGFSAQLRCPLSAEGRSRKLGVGLLLVQARVAQSKALAEVRSHELGRTAREGLRSAPDNPFGSSFPWAQ